MLLRNHDKLLLAGRRVQGRHADGDEPFRQEDRERPKYHKEFDLDPFLAGKVASEQLPGPPARS